MKSHVQNNEERICRVEDKVDLIISNHLPHIDAKINSIDSQVGSIKEEVGGIKKEIGTVSTNVEWLIYLAKIVIGIIGTIITGYLASLII